MSVDHAKLRELAEWATPGEWFPETYSDGHRQVCGDKRFVDDDEETYTTIADVHNRSDQEYLVAANPLTIIALLDEIDRLNAEWMAKCEELRKALAGASNLLEKVGAARWYDDSYSSARELYPEVFAAIDGAMAKKEGA